MTLPENCLERIQEWIKEKVDEAKLEGIVLGLSGGLDSSVAAVLCKKALRDRVLALLMPCHSDPQDLEHAKLVAGKFGIRTETIDLTESYETVLKSLPEGDKLARANLKPRLRMLTLYYFANLNRYLVAGTGNKTELSLGYFTKHGDGAMDILPLGGLFKTQVIELAGKLEIPSEIKNKPPSAGLWLGQRDEAELGMPYEELDRILKALEKGETRGLNPARLERVRELVKKSQHKRGVPPVCRL